MPKARHLIGITALTAAALVAGLQLAGSGETSPGPQAALGAAPTTSVPAGMQAAFDGGSSTGTGSPVVVVDPSDQPDPGPQALPDPGALAVGPGEIALPPGTWSAEFTISNVGGSAMAWSAMGVPATVGLSASKGSLAAGEQTTVTATVDHTKLAKGPFSLTLHVSAKDTAESVTLTGEKQIKVNVPQPPPVIKGK